MDRSRVLANYLDLHSRSCAAITTEGGVGSFDDYGDDVRRRVMVALLPDDLYKERIKILTENIESASQECGIGVMLAGRDFPVHRTIGQAVIEPDRFSEVADELSRDESMRRIMDALKQSDLKCQDEVIFIGRSGANAPFTLSICIGALDIPPIIRLAQEAIPAQYARFSGVKASPTRDFFHSTLARITKLPEQNARDGLVRWKDMIEEIGHKAKERCIFYSLDVYAGPMYPFLVSCET